MVGDGRIVVHGRHDVRGHRKLAKCAPPFLRPSAHPPLLPLSPGTPTRHLATHLTHPKNGRAAEVSVVLRVVPVVPKDVGKEGEAKVVPGGGFVGRWVGGAVGRWVGGSVRRCFSLNQPQS